MHCTCYIHASGAADHEHSTKVRRSPSCGCWHGRRQSRGPTTDIVRHVQEISVCRKMRDYDHSNTPNMVWMHFGNFRRTRAECVRSAARLWVPQSNCHCQQFDSIKIRHHRSVGDATLKRRRAQARHANMQTLLGQAAGAAWHGGTSYAAVHQRRQPVACAPGQDADQRWVGGAYTPLGNVNGHNAVRSMRAQVLHAMHCSE